MAKSNIVNHSLRLNLDNEQHRRVEQVLTNLNLKVHKSLNQFLIDAVDAYIKRLEGTDLTCESEAKEEKVVFVTHEEMESIRREIRDDLQREMIIILGSALAGGRTLPVPTVVQEAEEDDMSADETTIGLAASWG